MVCSNKSKPFPLLDLPAELVEKVVSTLGPEDQSAKKAARASCTQLRSAVNAAVSKVKVVRILDLSEHSDMMSFKRPITSLCFCLYGSACFIGSGLTCIPLQIASDMEGKALPLALIPRLRSVTLNVSNGKHLGLWTADNLASLGISLTSSECQVAIEADAAIVHLDRLRQLLVNSGLMHRVCSLNQQCWGVQGQSAQLGMGVEVYIASIDVVFCSSITADTEYTSILLDSSAKSFCFLVC